MFFNNSFSKKQPRKFSYSPYYYNAEADNDDGTGRSRIHFKRIRSGAPVSAKSVRAMVIMVVILLSFLAYFWGTLQRYRSFDMDSIKIEHIPESR